MGEKGKSLVESMKERISRSGSKKSVTFYLKKDGKCRVRFLQDMEEGIKIQFHDKFGDFSHPCLSYYGKKCPNCKNVEAKHVDNFVWSVWNYETKKVELFMFKASKASPIPALISMYENYGTITDRDYIIQRNGEGFDTNYSVIPMDKKRFKGEEEPYSKKKVLKMLLEAFPAEIEDEDADDEDEDEEIKPKKKASKKSKYEEEDDDEELDDEEDEEEEAPKKKSKKSKKQVEEDDDEDFDDDDEDEEEEKPKKKSKKASKKKSKKVEDDDDDEDDLPPWEDDDDEDDE